MGEIDEAGYRELFPILADKRNATTPEGEQAASDRADAFADKFMEEHTGDEYFELFVKAYRDVSAIRNATVEDINPRQLKERYQ